MAGICKPNKKDLGEEAKCQVLYCHSNGKITNKCGLFDGTAPNEWNTDNVFYWYDNYDILEINILEDCNIWRSGTESWIDYKDPLKILKFENNKYIDITSKVEQATSKIDNHEWEKTISNLSRGRYKFTYNKGLRIDSEWYLEKTKKYKYLLKQNNKYYSIKTDFYDKENKIYLPCERNFEKNGIEDLSEFVQKKYTDILKNQKININDFKSFNLNESFISLIKLSEISEIKKEYTDNIMPLMTSNKNSNIELKCSSIYNSSYEPFGLFDRKNEIDGGKSWATKLGTNDGWVEIKFDKKTNISKYTLQSRTGCGFIPEELPTEWIFVGSNNGKFLKDGKENIDFYILDRRNDTKIWNQNEKRIYDFFNNNSFLYYRFYFKTSDDNDKWVCIDNIELMSLKDEFKYKFLIKNNEEYYTIKNNELLKIDYCEDNYSLFFKNAFDDYYLITKKILLNKLNSLDEIQVLVFNKENNSDNLLLEYKLNKPFKPINCFKDEVELIQAEEK